MSAQESTSRTLLERARARDLSAWNRLLHLYRPLVLYWCRRAGVTDADADDVCQEVFTAVASGLDRFRRDQPGDSFRAWLRGITRNKLLHHQERRRGQPLAQGGTDAQRWLQEHPANPLEDPDPPEQDRALYRRGLELVRSEFPDHTWLAFWRTAVDGQAAPDVAAELGLSPAAVRQARSRVLRRLREELGDLLEA
jgi:RNA polymerase sigma-70 factor (ECF subfamily)